MAKNPSLPLSVHTVLDSSLAWDSNYISTIDRAWESSSKFGEHVDKEGLQQCILSGGAFFLPLSCKAVGYSAGALAHSIL